MKYHPQKVYVESAGQEFIVKYVSPTYLLRTSTFIFVLALRPFNVFLFHFCLSCGLPGYLLPERWQWMVTFRHICLHLLYCSLLDSVCFHIGQVPATYTNPNLEDKDFLSGFTPLWVLPLSCPKSRSSPCCKTCWV